MAFKLLKAFHADARHYQILTLSCLFLYQFFFSDFGSDPLTLLVTVFSVCLCQYGCARFLKLSTLDFKSPLITGLSLTLLLKTNFLWLYPIAAAFAIVSKFFVRVEGGHVFNPANIAIVILLLVAPNFVWVSPGQWGSAVWFAFFLLFFAGLVLGKATRIDTAVFFFLSYASLISGRALWLGDPLEIPLHQLQSGALLIFTFFMITDPKTTPASRASRFLFTLCVSILGFLLLFGFQIREGLFIALAVVSFCWFLLRKLMEYRQNC